MISNTLNLIILIGDRFFKVGSLCYFFILLFTVVTFCQPRYSLTDLPDWLSPQSKSPLLKFEHYTIEQGAPANEFLALLQDRLGFLWIGTGNGLARYDGFHFKNFFHDSDDSTTLSDNCVWSLLEDQQGMIWVGTESGGLNRLDPATGRVTRYIHQAEDTSSIADGYVLTLFEDHQQTLWAGLRGGALNRFNRESGTFTRYTHRERDTTSLGSNFVVDILEDSKKRFWVVMRGGGLQMMDRESGQFSSPPSHPDPAKRLETKSLTAIVEDPEGRLWLASTDHGLYLMNEEKAVDKSSWAFEQQPFNFSEDPSPQVHIFRMAMGSKGRLWLATWGSSLLQFDIGERSFIQHLDGDRKPGFITNNYVHSVLEDRFGVLWAGSDYGLNKALPKQQPFSVFQTNSDELQNLSRTKVHRLYRDSRGKLWLGTGNLSRLENALSPAEKPLFRVFENDPENPYSLPYGNVEAILEDHLGRMWIGLRDGGLSCYLPDADRFINYRHDPANPQSLSHNIVTSLYQDSQKRLWITTLGNGIDVLQLNDQALTGKETFRNMRIETDLKPNDKLDSWLTWTLLPDTAGMFWVGTSGGLFHVRPEDGKVLATYRQDANNPASLSDNHIRHLYLDPEGILWIATLSGGLNRLDPSTKSMTHYPIGEGVATYNVDWIQPDQRGNLWLATSGGLFRFDPRNGSQKGFTAEAGIPWSGMECGLLDADGRMIVGGTDGLITFYPEAVLDNPHPPAVAFTGLDLFNQPVSIDAPDSPLQKQLSHSDPFTLRHDQKVLTFRYVGLHFADPENVEYAYKLEGFDDNWSYVGPKREATYTNLSPGNYRFRVKAANADAVWNEAGAMIDFQVLPPWWRTWWAYLIYFLTAAALFLSLRRYELNRQSYKHQLELEKVEADKLKELDGLKSRFFANISHEFRTPLTLILGQIDSVLETQSDDRNANRLSMARRNADRLQQLINELLDLSRLEANRATLAARPVQFLSFLRGLVFSFETLAEDREIQLSFDAMPKNLENIEVFIDPGRLEKVFLNLLSNAMKFTPRKGTVAVIVRGPIPLPENSAGGEAIEVQVQDSGSGIPADQLPFIFDRFHQAGDAVSGELRGTGIGLALAREVVELHHGQISAESKVGEGSVFTVILPLGREHLQPEEITQENVEFGIWNAELEKYNSEFPTPNSEFPTPHSEFPYVLIVEDNQDVRHYLRDHLEKDFRVGEAINGEEGLQKAREELPDLIISDVMMPKMDGYAFSREIRRDELTCHIPIIMLTARAAEADKISGLETGVDAYLTKPFSPRELLVRVHNLIAMRQTLRERFRTATIVKPAMVSEVPLDQSFLEKALAFVEVHMEDDELNGDLLANEMNMSLSQLNRKLRALIDQPAGKLIRSLRLQRAADLLKQQAGTVAEIAYRLGFGSQAHFSKMFHKHFGQSPSEYRQSQK